MCTLVSKILARRSTTAGECERRVCSTAKPRTAVLALLNGNPPPIEVTAQDSLFAVILAMQR